MAKVIREKERKMYEALDRTLEELVSLQEEFLSNPSNEVGSNFAYLLDEYAKLGEGYFSQAENRFVDNRLEGIRDYLLGKIDKTYLESLWEEF